MFLGRVVRAVNKDIATRPDPDCWLDLVSPHASGVVQASAESWLIRADDGREVELVRRSVYIAYRTSPVLGLSPTWKQAGWGLGFAGLITAALAVVSGALAPNRSVAASAMIDIPKAAPAPAEPATRVIVQTRYVTLPPVEREATRTIPDSHDGNGDAPDVATALKRAFATDEAQSWATPTASGMVVVGMTQIQGAKHCRDVAILTRAEDGDSTVNNRYCQINGGRIAVEPSTSDSD